MKDEFEMTLHSPLSADEWAHLTDVELEHTTKIYFQTPSGKKVEFIPKSLPDAITITQEQAEAFCDHYCRFPREYDEEAHGIPLAESHICKNCPLSLAEIGGGNETA